VHLSKILHPGILNDCFHNSSTVVFEKRAKPLGRPLPMLNMCSTCPTSRRASVHLPRLVSARDQTRAALDLPAGTPALPPLQKAALTGYVTACDEIIGELRAQEAPA
jgi:hypothetical protein